MQAIRNLTPHAINIFSESAFNNLEQINPTTWVADGTFNEDALVSYESEGSARITVTTTEGELLNNLIPTVKTIYGELTGVPDDISETDVLIVSLPTQSMALASGHPLAKQMVTPYKVVRLRENTSQVMGCMGLSFQ